MRCTPKKTLNKIVRKGHDYVAQVKGNTKELLKWVDYNSSISEPIEEHITYDNNTHGRYEERVCQVYNSRGQTLNIHQQHATIQKNNKRDKKCQENQE